MIPSVAFVGGMGGPLEIGVFLLLSLLLMVPGLAVVLLALSLGDFRNSGSEDETATRGGTRARSVHVSPPIRDEGADRSGRSSDDGS